MSGFWLYNVSVHELKLILKDTFNHWSKQNPSRMGASLSYFAILSMVPLFLIVIAIAGFVFGRDIVESKLLYEIAGIAGYDITSYITQIIYHQAESGVSFTPAVISFIMLLFGTTGAFKELSYSMDKMWSIDEEKKPRRIRGIRQIIAILKSHIPLLFLLVILTLLFITSIVSGVSLQIIGSYIQTLFPDAFNIIKLLEPVTSFFFVALFFAVVYRVLPKTKLPWSEIVFGASVTAIVFLIGELFIGYYLGHFINASLYGAAGTLISILLWIYFSAQVFFLGAAFTFMYSKRYGYLRYKS
jgi:membrane protein